MSMSEEEAAKEKYPFPEKGIPGFYEILEQQMFRQSVFKEGALWQKNKENILVTALQDIIATGQNWDWGENFWAVKQAKEALKKYFNP